MNMIITQVFKMSKSAHDSSLYIPLSKLEKRFCTDL